jgi:hypothetical protein
MSRAVAFMDSTGRIQPGHAHSSVDLGAQNFFRLTGMAEGTGDFRFSRVFSVLF